jgi:flagellar protein FlaG
MESIKTATSMAPALSGPATKTPPQETAATKSKSSTHSKEYDAAEIRSTIYKNRLEASKNLEMAQSRLREISDSLNEHTRVKSQNLKFSADQLAERLVVTVSDKESGKVLKQVPSETILKISHSLEALKGILYDDKY